MDFYFKRKNELQLDFIHKFTKNEFFNLLLLILYFRTDNSNYQPISRTNCHSRFQIHQVLVLLWINYMQVTAFLRTLLWLNPYCEFKIKANPTSFNM